MGVKIPNGISPESKHTYFVYKGSRDITWHAIDIDR